MYSSSPIQPAVIASAQLLLSAANDSAPFSSATQILDLGCGPGTLTSELLNLYVGSLPPEVRITAVDASSAMIEQVLHVKAEQSSMHGPQSLWNKVDAQEDDAQNLSTIPDSACSHVLAGLLLFLLPDSDKALAECRRVLQSNGVLALTCWPRSDWQSLMRLLVEVRPDKAVYDVPAAWRSEGSIKVIIEKAGFADVRVHTVEVSAEYSDPDELCRWIVQSMPGLRALIHDFTEDDEERLVRVMAAWLQERNGPATGAVRGECIICTAKK